MIVTIHQPDFLPWFGFFKKIAKAEKWIVLDHVENNPRDSSFWGRRVSILVNGSPFWLSVPLRRSKVPGRTGVPICEMEINDDDKRVFERAWKTVKQAYVNTPYFEDHSDLVESYFESEETRLAERNLNFIFDVLARLHITVQVVRSSTMKATGSSSELLLELLTKTGATTYLHGLGAAGYQDDDIFVDAGIELVGNKFSHPKYSQPKVKDFVPGLSIIDLLFNVPTGELAERVNAL